MRWRRPSGFGCLLGGLSAVGLLFLFVPLLVLLGRALALRGWEQAPAAGMPQALALSFATTAVTTLLTVLFGTPLAYLLARRRFRGRRALELLIELPIVLPPAVAGLALLAAFGRRGLFGPLLETLGIALPFTTAAVVMAQIFVSAPFFIRAAQIGFEAVGEDLADAARVDGADERGLFWRLMLPLASRALAAGAVTSAARALGEFGATILFAGSIQGRTQTMPLLIYNVLERDLGAALWTGVILVGVALLALLAAGWLRRAVA